MPKKVPINQYKYCIQDLLYKQHGIRWREAKEDLAKAIDRDIKYLNNWIVMRKNDRSEIPENIQLKMMRFFNLNSIDELKYNAPAGKKKQFKKVA